MTHPGVIICDNGNWINFRGFADGKNKLSDFASTVDVFDATEDFSTIDFVGGNW